MYRSDVISVADLREVLRQERGLLYWKRRSPKMFSGVNPSRGAAQWNGTYSGKRAFTAKNNKGYHVGRIMGRDYLAHRVVFALTHGYWPRGCVDHINGEKTDNTPENLRDVTQSENMRNQRMSKRNRSGFLGVHWCKANGKWKAEICVNGRKKHLGVFTEKEDAISARKGAEKGHGFGPQHGAQG